MNITIAKLKKGANFLILFGLFDLFYTFVPRWSRPCFGACYSEQDINTQLKIAGFIILVGIVFRLALSFFEDNQNNKNNL